MENETRPNRKRGGNYVVREVRYSVAREPEAPPLTALGDPARVLELLRDVPEIVPDDGREHFVVLLLNAQNGLVAWHRASIGTVSATLVDARGVFGPALRHLGVSSVILVHNHPSGDPTPSAEDVRLTHRLVEAGKLLDVRVLDHVVVGSGTGAHVSMSAKGII